MFEDFPAFCHMLREHIGQMFLTDQFMVTMNDAGVIIIIPGDYRHLDTKEANDVMLKYLAASEN